jgi:diaminopimelate decarboxylase
MYKISGVSVETIAKKYQTPIYIYDEAHMIKNINDLKNNFKSKKYQIKILYASKAFTCKSMIKLAKNNGMCLDVVSGGELYLANSVKYDTSKIYFHGNNKLEQEIRDGLKAKIGAFVVDNKQELEKIINISNSIKLKANILIRLNPKVEAHTHEYIQTSKVDSKFGINIDYTDQIADMIKMCEKSKYIKVLGFHAHIGSQIFDMKGYEIEIENMLKFMSKINKLTNNDFGVLNLGSGFGVKYTDVDKPLPLAKVGK